MANFIAIIFVIIIVGGACRYIYKAKKSGAKCIGCPNSGCCGGSRGSSSNTGSSTAGSSCNCGCKSGNK